MKQALATKNYPIRLPPAEAVLDLDDLVRQGRQQAQGIGHDLGPSARRFEASSLRAWADMTCRTCQAQVWVQTHPPAHGTQLAGLALSNACSTIVADKERFGELELRLLVEGLAALSADERSRLARRSNLDQSIARALIGKTNHHLGVWMLMQEDQPDDTVRACIQDGDVFRQLLVLHHPKIGPRFESELAKAESIMVRQAVEQGLAGKPHTLWKPDAIPEATVERIIEQVSFQSRYRSFLVSYQEPKRTPDVPYPFLAWMEESWLESHMGWFGKHGGFGEFTSEALKERGHDWTVVGMSNGEACLAYQEGEYSDEGNLRHRLPLSDDYDWDDPDQDILDYIADHAPPEGVSEDDAVEDLRKKRSNNDEGTWHKLWPYMAANNASKISDAFATLDVLLHLTQELDTLGENAYEYFEEEATYRAQEYLDDSEWTELRAAFEKLSPSEARQVQEAYGRELGKGLARTIKARPVDADNLEAVCLVLEAADKLPRGY